MSSRSRKRQQPDYATTSWDEIGTAEAGIASSPDLQPKALPSSAATTTVLPPSRKASNASLGSPFPPSGRYLETGRHVPGEKINGEWGGERGRKSNTGGTSFGSPAQRTPCDTARIQELLEQHQVENKDTAVDAHLFLQMWVFGYDFPRVDIHWLTRIQIHPHF